jgi:hypothetical protein
MVPLGAEPSPPVLGEMLAVPDSTAGIRTSRMSAELREFFGAPPDAGVLLTRVTEGTAGARAGFRVGDVLVRLGDTPIRTPSDLLTRILVADETGELEASVVRRREAVRLVLDLSADRLAPGAGSGLLERYLESGSERENRVKMLEEEIRALNRRIRDLEEQLRKTGTDR